jgi:hypothetical protein
MQEINFIHLFPGAFTRPFVPYVDGIFNLHLTTTKTEQ